MNLALALGLLIGVAAIRPAAKVGFLVTWAALVNLVLAVYLAVTLLPFALAWAPAFIAASPYRHIFCLMMSGILLYAILQKVSTETFIGAFRGRFPGLIENVGAGALGFATAMLAWSYISLMVSLSPFVELDLMRTIEFERQNAVFAEPYLERCVSPLHEVVRIDGSPGMDELIASYHADIDSDTSAR